MDSSTLFPLLAARYGVGTALQIIGLLDPNASALNKAFGALGAGQVALSGAGALSGNTALQSLGGNLGKALGLAGTGLGIYQTATNPNLSTAQKAGHSGELAGEAALSATVPYAGLGVLAKNLIGQLVRSGSPQVAATGRALQGPALPVEGLLNVITGDMTPKQSFNNMIASTGRIPIVGHGLKQALQVFGLGTPPTTGTMMRREIGNVARQLPALKGFKPMQDALTADQYNAFSPIAQQSAYGLADYLGKYAPDYAKNQNAYQVQVGNSLLKQYGEGVPDLLKALSTPPPPPSPMWQGQPMTPVQQQAANWVNPNGIGAIAQNYMQQKGQFQPGLSQNKLPSILGTLVAR